MKKVVVILILLGLYVGSVHAQSSYPLDGTAKRILFIGNSITYAAHYVDYAVTAIYLENPGKKWEAINVGLPSETVSGLSEPDHAGGQFPRPYLHDRLDRILEEVKPDLVFSCYGMNDGIYMPFDEGRFARFKEGIQLLHTKVTERSIPLVHLTPPVYDPKKDPAYAAVLDTYAQWLLEQRDESKWQVIDLHFPMRDFLLEQRKTDPDFVLSPDAIHPNQTGHWIMAKSLLKGIGIHSADGKTSANAYFESKENGQAVYELVRNYQSVTKDAWLSHIGHNRPGMKEGVPLREAIQAGKKARKEIRKLTKKKVG